MDEETKIIKELWDKEMSLTQISAQTGMTRSKIAGKIYRLRQSGVDLHMRPTFKKEKKPKKETPRALYLAKKIVVDVPAGILDLRFTSCRFILNENTRAPIYCMKTVVRKSYCQHHLSICYHSIKSA